MRQVFIWIVWALSVYEAVASSENKKPRVDTISWSPGSPDFTIHGAGFEPGSLVHIAQYTKASGWEYRVSLQPVALTPESIQVHSTELPRPEYLIIVQSPSGAVSAPAPFGSSTRARYKLPIAGGEQWILTQGPNGSFSHWGNTVQAFDFAPESSRKVVAMRDGIAHTFDLGLKQDHRRRSFGNYITIDHGDGEYSHYAHLESGTFQVHDGEHVVQGQVLATAGNSGYTFGEGGGYHVHVQVSRSPAITAQSIPFKLDDLIGSPAGRLGRAVSSTNYPRTLPARNAAQQTLGLPVQFAEAIAVEQWWSDVVSVSKRAKVLSVQLHWNDANAKLDLHLVSPHGRHYGWYGDRTGYSGETSNPQEFNLAHPEPGIWRIAVQAVQGGPAPVEFDVRTSALKVN